MAREGGLGTSLLERLFSVYKETKLAKSHVSTLLTNYRCHPSILMLASSLFYECTLLSRSDSKSLPGAPFPIVFESSSISRSNFANAPSDSMDEASILVSRMLDFILNDWPRSEKQTSVGLLASTRKQVCEVMTYVWQFYVGNTHFQAENLKIAFRRECQKRKVIRNNLPCLVDIITTYIIQGM